MTKKRVILSCLLLVVLTIFSTACSNDLFKTKEEKISLKLAGFPSKFDTYNLKIYVEGDGGRGDTNVYEYNGISFDDILKKSLVVNKNSDFMMIYLFENVDHTIYYNEPIYFWRIELEDSKKEYEVSYWMNYDSYESSEYIEYGISEQMAQTVESPFCEEINFAEKPYYLYKLSSVQDQDIGIEVKSSEGEVCVSYSSEIDYKLQSSRNYDVYSTNYERYIYTWYGENLYILIKPNDQSTKATVNIKTVKSSYIGNRVIDMVAGDTPNIVYALDDKSNLYSIDPLNKSIENEFCLSEYNRTVAMSYCSIKKKLYILCEDGEIIVWDTVNEIINIISFLTDKSYIGAKDIEVASKLGYIYVSSSSGITIIDLDTEEEIITVNKGDFNSITIDENNKKLFGYKYYDGLYKYSLEADHTLTELKNNPMYIYGDIELTPDGSKMIMYGTSSSYLYTLKVYDTANIDNLLGDFDIVNFSDFTLSPDGSILYVSTLDYSISVLDMETYSEIRKLNFGNNYNSKIITNSDGSVLIAVGATYGDYRIYYFEDIQK